MKKNEKFVYVIYDDMTQDNEQSVILKLSDFLRLKRSLNDLTYRIGSYSVSYKDEVVDLDLTGNIKEVDYIYFEECYEGNYKNFINYGGATTVINEKGEDITSQIMAKIAEHEKWSAKLKEEKAKTEAEIAEHEAKFANELAKENEVYIASKPWAEAFEVFERLKAEHPNTKGQTAFCKRAETYGENVSVCWGNPPWLGVCNVCYIVAYDLYGEVVDVLF